MIDDGCCAALSGDALRCITSWCEDMEFVDATYFTVVTATTVGFGDYSPQTYEGTANLRP